MSISQDEQYKEQYEADMKMQIQQVAAECTKFPYAIIKLIFGFTGNTIHPFMDVIMLFKMEEKNYIIAMKLNREMKTILNSYWTKQGNHILLNKKQGVFQVGILYKDANYLIDFFLITTESPHLLEYLDSGKNYKRYVPE